MSAAQAARRETIIAMTVAGRPQAEIALAINGSIRTVRRWQREPAVVAAVTAAAAALEQAALADCAALRDAALAVLRDHLASDDPVVQFRAAKAAFEQHVVQRELGREDKAAAMDAALAQVEARARRAGWFR